MNLDKIIERLNKRKHLLSIDFSLPDNTDLIFSNSLQ